jgi:hypothetical protein
MGHAARMGKTRNAYKIFVKEPEGKGPVTRPNHRCEYNIKMDLKEMLEAVVNLRVP